MLKREGKDFDQYLKWPNPVILKNGDGIFPLRAAQRRVKEIKIPCESWKVQLYFPMRGLAGILKKNFPMSGEAANGEIFFSVWLLSLEWGNIIVPWMTKREFFPSPFFKMTGLTFLFSYWKLQQKYHYKIWLFTLSQALACFRGLYGVVRVLIDFSWSTESKQIGKFLQAHCNLVLIEFWSQTVIVLMLR